MILIITSCHASYQNENTEVYAEKFDIFKEYMEESVDICMPKGRKCKTTTKNEAEYGK